MTWIKDVFQKAEGKAKICIFGLENAGKTAILNYLVSGAPIKTYPTISANYEHLEIKDSINFDIYDLPGQKLLRKTWERHLKGSTLFVLVIDTSAPIRMPEVKEMFWSVQEQFNPDMRIPVCILANKQDLGVHLSINEINTLLGLKKLDLNTWMTIGTSAITGEGIIEFFQWCVDKVVGQKINIEIHIHDLFILGKKGQPIVIKSFITDRSVAEKGYLSLVQKFQSNFGQDFNDDASLVKKGIKVYIKNTNNYFLAILVDQNDDSRVIDLILDKLAAEINVHPLAEIANSVNQFVNASLRILIKKYSSPDV